MQECAEAKLYLAFSKVSNIDFIGKWEILNRLRKCHATSVSEWLKEILRELTEEKTGM